MVQTRVGAPKRSLLVGSFAAAVLIAVLARSVHAGADPASTSPPEESVAATIAADHRKADDEIRNARISPFTAIASEYFEPGKSSRLGADGGTFVKDPPKPVAVMAELTFQDGAFTVSPVTGAAPPTLHAATEGGNVEPGDGKPVTPRTRLAAGDVVKLGRFYLETSPQSGYGRVLVYDPESPQKKSFAGLKWFDPNPALRVKARFTAAEVPSPITVATTRGLKKQFFYVGSFELTVADSVQHLIALAGSTTPKKGDNLFIPFRDATTGKESYGAGRYLNVAFDAPGSEYVIDFNSATNPSCNYSPHYNCPIPPDENHLTVPIRAGERTYPIHE